MSLENFNPSPLTPPQEKEMVPPQFFPIIEKTEPVKEKTAVSFEDDHITHYFLKRTAASWSTEYFTLPTEIDALDYSFDLQEMYGMHELSFSTKDYGYAWTSLSEEGTAKLEATLKKFIESVLQKYPLEELYIRPAPETATVREIEDCIEDLILLYGHYKTREQLLKECKQQGWDYLFSEYHRLSGKEFKQSRSSTDRTAVRARLFKNMFKRIFPDWKINMITDEKWILKKIPQKDTQLSSENSR